MIHLSNNPLDIRNCMEKMKRKQRMSIGDYSHPNLQFLYSLELTFPGWEVKLKAAVNDHRNGWSIDYFRYFLIERQRMFEGVRVHPRLVALDELVLSYPGWRKDVKAVERNHLDDSFFYNGGVHDMYQSQLDVLKSKQMAYEAGDAHWSCHPIQKEILSTEWTYPGFEDA